MTGDAKSDAEASASRTDAPPRRVEPAAAEIDRLEPSEFGCRRLEPSDPTGGRFMHPALLASVFVIATSGLVYELVCGTLASYVLGDSVTQFSLVIGIYLSAMGVGSFLSQYIERDLLARFVEIELCVAVVGGFSATLLFRAFALGGAFRGLLYVLVFLIGALVGLEIPLLTRLLRFTLDLKELVARVLTLDYVGALFASLLFPSILLPRLGLHQTSFLFGFLNALVALGSTFLFPIARPRLLRLRTLCVLVLGVLGSGFFYVPRIVDATEANYYGAPIVFSHQSVYQRIVITQTPRTLRLWLNGNLQFSSDDEARYHEVLVHPAVAALGREPRRVVVLGGGDGLAARELLRYPGIESIVLVDLDGAVTRVFSSLPIATRINGGSLTDPRVIVRNEDAFRWLEETTESFDLAIVDFPDPSSFAVGKLYTDSFYRLLRQRLGMRGAAVVQATSPQYARESFWSIVTTIEAAGFTTIPFHVYVPSFGEWGFVLCGSDGITAPSALGLPTASLAWLEPSALPELFRFPRDLGRVEGSVNRLNDQRLVATYAREWASWTK